MLLNFLPDFMAVDHGRTLGSCIVYMPCNGRWRSCYLGRNDPADAFLASGRQHVKFIQNNGKNLLRFGWLVMLNLTGSHGGRLHLDWAIYVLF